MIKRSVLLDGKHNGLCAYLKKEKMVFTNDAGDSVFTNLKSISAAIHRAKIDYHLYKYQFYLETGDVIDMNNCIILDNGTYIYIGKDEIIEITETEDCEVSRTYYITSDKSDTHNGDAKFEYTKLKTIRNNIKKSILSLTKNTKYGITLSRNTMGININILNSTAQIFICSNDKLMKYNISAKEKNERVLPFDKTMDKFGTLYCFVCVDMIEKYNKDVNNMIDFIIKSLEDTSNSIQSECTYSIKQNQIKGYIKFNRKELFNGGNN